MNLRITQKRFHIERRILLLLLQPSDKVFSQSAWDSWVNNKQSENWSCICILRVFLSWKLKRQEFVLNPESFLSRRFYVILWQFVGYFCIWFRQSERRLRKVSQFSQRAIESGKVCLQDKVEECIGVEKNQHSIKVKFETWFCKKKYFL